MKLILSLLFVLSITCCRSQVSSFIGIQNTSFTYYSELDTSRFIVRLQVLIGLRDKDENLFMLKTGYRVLRFTEKKNLSLLIYMPVFNYSFTERAYNTPFNTELEYRLKGVRLSTGVYVYKDKVNYYGTILIPFK